MNDFNIKVREEGDITILETSGYLNNFGGDKVASICKQSISEGKRKLLINMENTKMVNSHILSRCKAIVCLNSIQIINT